MEMLLCRFPVVDIIVIIIIIIIRFFLHNGQAGAQKGSQFWVDLDSIKVDPDQHHVMWRFDPSSQPFGHSLLK